MAYAPLPSGARRAAFRKAGDHALQRGDVALQPPDIRGVPLDEAVGDVRGVALDGDLMDTARRLGTSFGD